MHIRRCRLWPPARTLTGGHGLDFGLGEGSPQARLYDRDGRILLLGVGHANNTSLHLAEHRAAEAVPTRTESSPMIVDGRREWMSHTSLDDDSDFDALGEAFAATGRRISGAVGAGSAHVMGAREIVDFATGWMRRHRRP